MLMNDLDGKGWMARAVLPRLMMGIMRLFEEAPSITLGHLFTEIRNRLTEFGSVILSSSFLPHNRSRA